jgi:hypothetical protein
MASARALQHLPRHVRSGRTIKQLGGVCRRRMTSDRNFGYRTARAASVH